jgi:hypothetical protein
MGNDHFLQLIVLTRITHDPINTRVLLSTYLPRMRWMNLSYPRKTGNPAVRAKRGRGFFVEGERESHDLNKHRLHLQGSVPAAEARAIRIARSASVGTRQSHGTRSVCIGVSPGLNELWRATQRCAPRTNVSDHERWFFLDTLLSSDEYVLIIHEVDFFAHTGLGSGVYEI